MFLSDCVSVCLSVCVGSELVNQTVAALNAIAHFSRNSQDMIRQIFFYIKGCVATVKIENLLVEMHSHRHLIVFSSIDKCVYCQ